MLAQHPLIRESIVVAREDAGGEKRLIAYVASDDLKEQGSGINSLRMYLMERLPEYMVPAAFVFLDTLPLTSNGKVNREALPESDVSMQIANQYVAPRNTIEEILTQIWEKVLRLERVGIDDNFFVLGGDSILSIQVVGLAKERGLTLPMEQLYQCGTIRSLAQVLTSCNTYSSEIRKIEAFSLITVEDQSKLSKDIEDAYPLTAMQAGMIFHSEQGLGAYHVVDSIKVECVLDPACLRVTLEQVFARHSILRTTFDLGVFSAPLKLVHQQCGSSLTTYDVCHR